VEVASPGSCLQCLHAAKVDTQIVWLLVKLADRLLLIDVYVLLSSTGGSQ